MTDTNNTPEDPKSSKDSGKESTRKSGPAKKKSTKASSQTADKQAKKKSSDTPDKKKAAKDQHKPKQEKPKSRPAKKAKKEKPVPPKEDPQADKKPDQHDSDYDRHPDEYPYEEDQYEYSDDYVKQSESVPEPEPENAGQDSAEDGSSKEDENTVEDDDTTASAKSKSTKKKKTEKKEKKMPFLDHLEELRWTILRSLIAIMIGAIVSYIFSKEIITFLRSLGPEDLKLIFLAPTEGFMIYIKVSLWAGLVVSFPYIAYQFWQFIVPGLYEKEKKYVPHIAFFTTLCFLTGASFASFIIIPFGLKFLLGFQTDFLAANITIGKYLGFVVTIILVFGVVFELPVLSFFLTRIGLLTPQFLQKNRRYGIVMIFIGAAVLTPPDVFTQLMLAGPLILLYEVSIWVSKAVIKRKNG